MTSFHGIYLGPAQWRVAVLACDAKPTRLLSSPAHPSSYPSALKHFCYFGILESWQVVHPSKDPKVKKYHDAKYRIFRELYEQQLSQRSIMAQALA